MSRGQGQRGQVLPRNIFVTDGPIEDEELPCAVSALVVTADKIVSRRLRAPQNKWEMAEAIYEHMEEVPGGDERRQALAQILTQKALSAHRFFTDTPIPFSNPLATVQLLGYARRDCVREIDKRF